MNENLPLPWSLVVYETTARVYGEFESLLGVLKIENNYYPFTETDYRAPHVMLQGRQGGSFPMHLLRSRNWDVNVACSEWIGNIGSTARTNSRLLVGYNNGYECEQNLLRGL